MNVLNGRLLGVVAVCVGLTAGSVQANANLVGANERLAFSDKLTMYSQRIASSACAFTMDNAPFESRGFLGVAGLEVDRILNALENGDRALGIPTPEQNPEILDMVRKIKSDWGPIKDMSRSVLDGSASPSLLRELEIKNNAFTEEAQRLVTLISNKYSDTSSLILTDAIRLQVAGRQRMLSQKLSHEVCKIQKGTDRDALTTMAEVSQTFELSANALRRGMPEVGIVATTDPVLLAALDDISERWSELKWPLFALEHNAEWDTNTKVRMYLKFNELAHEMDKIVVEFTKASALALSN